MKAAIYSSRWTLFTTFDAVRFLQDCRGKSTKLSRRTDPRRGARVMTLWTLVAGPIYNAQGRDGGRFEVRATRRPRLTWRGGRTMATRNGSIRSDVWRRLGSPCSLYASVSIYRSAPRCNKPPEGVAAGRSSVALSSGYARQARGKSKRAGVERGAGRDRSPPRSRPDRPRYARTRRTKAAGLSVSAPVSWIELHRERDALDST